MPLLIAAVVSDGTGHGKIRGLNADRRFADCGQRAQGRAKHCGQES